MVAMPAFDKHRVNVDEREFHVIETTIIKSSHAQIELRKQSAHRRFSARRSACAMHDRRRDALAAHARQGMGDLLLHLWNDLFASLRIASAGDK